VSAEFALDFMFWATNDVGWYFEPTYSISPRSAALRWWLGGTSTARRACEMTGLFHFTDVLAPNSGVILNLRDAGRRFLPLDHLTKSAARRRRPAALGADHPGAELAHEEIAGY
jgi:hypothetical protein